MVFHFACCYDRIDRIAYCFISIAKGSFDKPGKKFTDRIKLFVMIRNYLKVAMRYLLRHKGYTAINVLGLAIGIACCMLIMMFVRSEFSYDKFHSKSGRIYRAWVKEHYVDQDDIIDIVTPLPLAGALQESFAEKIGRAHV